MHYKKIIISMKSIINIKIIRSWVNRVSFVSHTCTDSLKRLKINFKTNLIHSISHFSLSVWLFSPPPFSLSPIFLSFAQNFHFCRVFIANEEFFFSFSHRLMICARENSLKKNFFFFFYVKFSTFSPEENFFSSFIAT